VQRRNPEQEARRTEIIALFCLMEQDLSGYGLRRLLQDWNILEHLPISPATVYRSLVRLEKQGLLTSKKVRQGRYPTATVYSITKAGRKRYKELLAVESKFARVSYPSNIFLGAGSYLTRKERIAVARKWKEDAHKVAGRLRTQQENKKDPVTYGKPFAEWLLLDYERHMLQAEMEWLDTYCRLLNEGRA